MSSRNYFDCPADIVASRERVGSLFCFSITHVRRRLITS